MCAKQRLVTLPCLIGARMMPAHANLRNGIHGNLPRMTRDQQRPLMMRKQRMKNLILFGVLLVATTACNEVAQAPHSIPGPAFIEWASDHATTIHALDPVEDNRDLAVIANAIGSARVVTISETYHNSGEIMRLHDRVIRYLVAEHGFNTVVAETSLPESRAIHNYVLGEPPIDNLWWNGINTMYGEWREGRALIEWLRKYNQDGPDVPVHYYGIDIAGFYRDWRPPFNQVMDYLDPLDPEFSAEIKQTVLPIIEIMGDDARPRYLDLLDARQRAELTLALDRLVDRFAEQEDEYRGNSTETAFQWARQSAISLQLADNYYHNYEQQTRGKGAQYAGLNGREVAMSRNIAWVLEQREDARVIVINHIIHTKTESMYQGETWGHLTPMGAFLRQQLGEDLYGIGVAYGDGEFWDGWKALEGRALKPVAPAANNGIEATLGNIAKGDFFLDFRAAPASARGWLNEVTTIRETNEEYINIRPSEWDGIIFLDHAGGATPVIGR